MLDGLSVTVRALSFVLLLQAAGIAIFLALFGERQTNSRTTVGTSLQGMLWHSSARGALISGCKGGWQPDGFRRPEHRLPGGNFVYPEEI
jgi:hypothetical protein